MAKEHEQQKPVQGQQPVKTTAETVAPPPKPASETAVPSTLPPSKEQEEKAKAPPGPDGKSLLAHLVSTGTNPDRLEAGKALLKEKPDATGDEVYKALETSGVALGTLRKAIKFVRQDEAAEPDSINAAAPADELLRLRGENEQLRKQLDQANFAKLATTKERDFTVEKNKDLANQVRILRAGKSHEELVRAGVIKEESSDK